MNESTLPAASPHWRLRHAWRSESDLAALALCRAELAGVGIAFADAHDDATADAIKMHGMEITDALAAGGPRLHDLRDAAVAARWEETLPRFVQRHMIHADRWHGIPIGIHRANAAWVHAATAKRIGVQAPADAAGFIAWLERARRATSSPLAVGAEPWQVGLLFESAVLAVAGPDAYRRAFEQMDPSVWREPAMLAAIEHLLALREFVADDHLASGWSQQLARVQRGEAAVQIMGDWVRVGDTNDILEWAVPGTAGFFVSIADYFVPLARTSKSVSDRVGVVLTGVGFQRRLARIKGCLPAVREACDGVDLVRARLLGRESAVLPSLVFDQCCAAGTRQVLLDVAARSFVQRGDPAACARALADATQ